MEVVISFDDTGSMSSVRKQVRQRITELVKQLFTLNPTTRIGIIIHNDYCDSDTIQHLDLTNNEKEIINFVNKNSSCGGGDADECYELALNYFHTQFSWKSDKRIAILIGDCEPHEVGYRYGGKVVNTLDWKEEAKRCVTSGIKIYPIQALADYYDRRSKKNFYATLSQISGTPKLDLSQFTHITQFITAVAYQEEGKLEEYENSQSEFKTNLSFRNMFNKLKGITDSPTISSSGDVKLSSLESRFQVLNVGSSPRVIKDFVEDNGATFRKGRGFYQFILTETIQENKEVLMVNKSTGEVQSDTKWCREQLGVPLGTRGRVNPRSLDVSRNYDIFIQSTSYNRKLDPNTKFLYELDYK
jgi:hypothetical protein